MTTSRRTVPADWDPLADDAVADPIAAHARLREQCPGSFSDRWDGFWSLTRHEDVVAAALDTETFISGEKTTIPDSTGPGRPPRPPLEADRPEHTQYRRLLAPYFAPPRIAEWEPTIRAIAIELLEPAVRRRECDMIAELALPLPARVLCAFMGLPAADWIDLKRWTGDVIEGGRAGDTERHTRANDALYEYVRSIVAARRHESRDPSQDVIAGLIGVVIDGRPLNDDQITGVIRLLLQAGHNTTTNGIGSALRHLGTHPEAQDRLRAEPDRIPAAVDELLRAFTPAQLLARTVTRPIDVGGRTLEPGQKVCLFWASANRDPEAFDQADGIDLSRHPNRHVAFGYGIHRCLGATLARVEMRLVLEELLARTQSFELVGPAPEAGWPHIGPSALPIRLAAAH